MDLSVQQPSYLILSFTYILSLCSPPHDGGVARGQWSFRLFLVCVEMTVSMFSSVSCCTLLASHKRYFLLSIQRRPLHNRTCIAPWKVLPFRLVNNQRCASDTFVPLAAKYSNGVHIVLAMNAVAVSASPVPFRSKQQKRNWPHPDIQIHEIRPSAVGIVKKPTVDRMYIRIVVDASYQLPEPHPYLTAHSQRYSRPPRESRSWKRILSENYTWQSYKFVTNPRRHTETPIWFPRKFTRTQHGRIRG